MIACPLTTAARPRTGPRSRCGAWPGPVTGSAAARSAGRRRRASRGRAPACGRCASGPARWTPERRGRVEGQVVVEELTEEEVVPAVWVGLSRLTRLCAGSVISWIGPTAEVVGGIEHAPGLADVVQRLLGRGGRRRERRRVREHPPEVHRRAAPRLLRAAQRQRPGGRGRHRSRPDRRPAHPGEEARLLSLLAGSFVSGSASSPRGSRACPISYVPQVSPKTFTDSDAADP